MKRQRFYRSFIGIGVLVIVSLACGLTEAVDRVREGQQAIETIQGVATQFDESGMLETGQAVATKIDESGLQETAQAVATDIDESGLQETAQAVVTEIDESGVKETAQAFATEIVVEPGDVPPDIPIMDGEKEAFVGSDQVISYFIKAEFQDVLNYYQAEMPARGWTQVDAGTIVTDTTATLQYEKDGRRVDIILGEVPFVGQVTVVINMQ